MTPPKASGRVEVEALSEARWNRIEEGLFARIERDERAALATMPPPEPARTLSDRVRGRAPLAAAAAVLLLAAAAMAGLVMRPAGGALAASRITTGASESHIALGEAALDVGPDSALLVSGDDDRGVLVVLDRGDVDFEVAPRKKRPPFVVEAGDVRVRVVGTRFQVHRGLGSARVDVSKGVVEVTSRGVTVRVAAGESWSSAPVAGGALAGAGAPEAVRPAAPASAPPDDDMTLEEDDPAPRRPEAKHAVRRRVMPHGKARPRAVETEPLAPAPPPPPGSAPVARAPTTATLPAAPAGDAPPAAASLGPSPQQRYEAAARIERGEPDAALAVYRDVARADGPWASNALYAAGRLQAERGANADARRILEEYLRRFPSGPNAADAHALLGRLH